MSARPLCVEPEPVLRRAARPVLRFTAELRRLARDLIDTMYASDGIGLAAPQIGCDVQVFVANPTQQPGRELVAVNPVVLPLGGRAAIQEGCLSLPDVWDRVVRAARVRLRGQDLDGRAFSLEAEGLLAIILQHEADHLHGCLFIDRLSWFRRRRALARLRGAAGARQGRLAPKRPEQEADILTAAPDAATC